MHPNDSAFIERMLDTLARDIHNEIVSRYGHEVWCNLQIYVDPHLYKQRKFGFYGWREYQGLRHSISVDGRMDSLIDEHLIMRHVELQDIATKYEEDYNKRMNGIV